MTSKPCAFALVIFSILFSGCGAPPAPPVAEARAATSRETPAGCQPLVAEVKLRVREEPFCLEGSLKGIEVLASYNSYAIVKVDCGCR